MLASFALLVIARALGETPEQGKPCPVTTLLHTEHVDLTTKRFEILWKDWVEASRVQFSDRQHPELEKLFSRTAKVMAEFAMVVSDVKMKIPKEGKLEMPSARLVEILKHTRKAIVSGQRITHLEEIQTWVLPEKPPPGTPPSDPSLKEYERRIRLNEKANTLVERRKKPVQCCMFVALALYQFLYGNEAHDFVAQYEDEVVRETFNRAISVDDAKTYEWSQLNQHSRARLTPPQDRIPKYGLAFGETTCTPRYVRNPMACGAPIVTNQLRLDQNEREYINLNRNNRPQHLAKAVPQSCFEERSDGGSLFSASGRPQEYFHA